MQDDMVGGWCVMTADVSPVYAQPELGHLQPVRGVTQQEAYDIARRHNAELAGVPHLATARHQVPVQDVHVFDVLGEHLTRAQQRMQAADLAQGYYPASGVDDLRECLRSLLDVVDLLVEATILVRSAQARER